MTFADVARYRKRDRKLIKLGYTSYENYLTSKRWITRRTELQLTHASLCHICGRLARSLGIVQKVSVPRLGNGSA